jgi:hypothetical protein
MKINGKSVEFQGKKTIVLTDKSGNDHSLTMYAPSPAFADEVEELFPYPIVPKTFLRNAKNHIERDQGGSPIMVEDKTDKTYITKRREAIQLQSAVVIYGVLKNDPNIEFDCGKPANKDDRDFYIKLRDELVKTFSNASYTKLLEAAYSLFTIDEEAISEAEKSFRE